MMPLPLLPHPHVHEVVTCQPHVAARGIGQVDPVTTRAAQDREMFVAARLDEDDDRPLQLVHLFGRDAEALRPVATTLRDALHVEKGEALLLS